MSDWPWVQIIAAGVILTGLLLLVIERTPGPPQSGMAADVDKRAHAALLAWFAAPRPSQERHGGG